MIEIVGRLVRDQTSVFLSGESVEVIISIRNKPRPEHKIAQGNNDSQEGLAWGTAQIHCYESSALQDKHSTGDQPGAHEETSLNALATSMGNILFASDPKILFCDLRLAPGENKTFFYKDTLKTSLPPTYRGLNIRYFYKVTIAAQKIGSSIQTLQIPIRVLPLPKEVNADDIGVDCNETTEELAPSNPFLEKEQKESKLDIILHNLQNITARRRPNFYLISNKRGKVGRFCLFKSAYKLGEDLVGSLDFTCRSVRCIQVSVTLQNEEIMLPKTNVDKEQGKKLIGKIINYTKHHEVCAGLMQTQVILPIPLHVTPTFTSDKVDVRWRLHFEFVTSADENVNEFKSNNKGEWHAPTDISIETMIWNLPVTLYPTAPIQIPQQTGTYKLKMR